MGRACAPLTTTRPHTRAPISIHARAAMNADSLPPIPSPLHLVQEVDVKNFAGKRATAPSAAEPSAAMPDDKYFELWVRCAGEHTYCRP
jgi:hypothetical protein